MFKQGHKKIGGRKEGVKNRVSQELIDKFLATLNEVELDKKISQGRHLIRHIIERAYKNDVVALGILRKLIPDLSFNINELKIPEPVKVTFDIIDSSHSLKEEMIETNRAGIFNILTKVRTGELQVTEGLERLGTELLKTKEEVKNYG